MFKFYYKLHIYLHKWSLNKTIGTKDKYFAYTFFVQLLLMNFFVSSTIKKISSQPLRRFYSFFVNSSLSRYHFSRRVIPDRNYYFNRYNYIKGANFQ
jgi:hypothetical protein